MVNPTPVFKLMLTLHLGVRIKNLTMLFTCDEGTDDGGLVCDSCRFLHVSVTGFAREVLSLAVLIELFSRY